MPTETIIQVKKGLSTEWTSSNPTLAAGEWGLETDTKKMKIGDGSTAWNSLVYSVKQIDNILVNSNTISSTDTNGNITLSPNGTGSVVVTVDVYSNTSKLLATREYVDAVKQGLDVKNSVRVATTANVSFNIVASGGGGATVDSILIVGTQIDGVSVAVGDRVLVKNTGSFFNIASHQLGIYRVNNVYINSIGLGRSNDADANDKVNPGMFTFVEEGTQNADSAWVLTTDGPISLGTTSLTFAQFNGAGQITAGGGMTKTGNTLNVIGTSNRISVNADDIDIASTYVGQSSITTLGTIDTGTWQASTIAAVFGGTGITSYATGDLLYASGSNTLSKLSAGTSKQFLKINSAETAPEWKSTLDGGTP